MLTTIVLIVLTIAFAAGTVTMFKKSDKKFEEVTMTEISFVIMAVITLLLAVATFGSINALI